MSTNMDDYRRSIGGVYVVLPVSKPEIKDEFGYYWWWDAWNGKYEMAFDEYLDYDF